MMALLILSKFWTVMAVIGFLILAAVLIGLFGGFGELVSFILWDWWSDE